jgi:putative membrane protein
VIAPRDPGLQPERTELSWRRTLLALAVGSLISIRVLAEALGGWAVASGVGGLVAATALWVLAQRRHRAVAAAFAARAGAPGGSAPAMPGGALLLALALLVTAGAALGLAAELLHP